MYKIAIIGASNMQRPLVEKANTMGLETHVFAWEKGEVVSDIAFKFYPISVLEKEKILNVCTEIDIDGILTIGSDIAVDTVNFVANKMELVGNSMSSTQMTRDKHLMREKLAEAGLPVPGFKVINSVDELKNLDFAPPYMIKAVDRSGSRGIQLVKKDSERTEAYANAMEVSLNKKVLVENYFDGKQYSLEVLSQNGNHNFVGITEEFYTGPPQFVETGHIMPGPISKKNLEKGLELTFSALDALEIKNGASHTELRINRDNEFCFIEIAGRMGGDFRANLIELAYNYDYIEDSIKIALDPLLCLTWCASALHKVNA